MMLLLLLVLVPQAGARKKVALVLGGGGAKGMAHIGVLKVLEQVGMPIDYVVGTSMGALVGALYAIGYTPEAIDSMVHAQNWSRLLSDKQARGNQSFPEKEISERYVLSLPFGRAKSQRYVRGMVEGRNLQNLFSDLTIGYQDSIDFNKLPIPFACVAVDAVTGRQHVFHSGNLTQAMRASMAVLLVFTPVRMDSMVLVDGGISDNYPVDVARKMGADVVIGVDLGTSDLKTYKQLNTPSDIVGQFISFYGNTLYQQNCKNTDILLRPDVHPYNAASFYFPAIDTLIDRGEAEARRHYAQLLALKRSLGPDSLPTNRPKPHIVRSGDCFSIRHIRMEGIDPRDRNWLLHLSGLSENSRINVLQLREAISRLMGTTAYASVNYSLSGKGPYDLDLLLRPKAGSSLHLGVRFDSEEIMAGTLKASLNYRHHGRSEVSFTGRAGAKTSFAKLNYQYGRTPIRGLDLSYMFSFRDLDIYTKGKKTLNAGFRTYTAGLAYTDMSLPNLKFSVGARYEYFDYNNFLYSGGFKTAYDNTNQGFFSYFMQTRVETFDQAYFPSKGFSLKADYSMYTDNLVSYKNHFPLITAAMQFSTVASFNTHLSIQPSVYLRGVIGDGAAFPYLNATGGEMAGKYLPQQIPFTGITRLELTDNYLGVVRLRLRQRISGRNYISLIGNYGTANPHLTGLFSGTHLWGAGLEYAYNSLLGPLSANLSLSNRHPAPIFYLNLGLSF
jgi:NTE family protein